MLKYDPLNFNLINDIKEQVYKNNNLSDNFKKYFPLVNFDDLEKLNLTHCPRNGCSAYYIDKNTNQIYGNYMNSHWKLETNNYNWTSILQTGSFLFN
jgi:hypothetical protein